MTAETSAPAITPFERLLARVVHVERREIAALVLSFTYFFFVLAAYYIVRPIRDEMGVMVGTGGLERIFTYVFLVMLCAVPVFGWVVSTFERRTIVPLIYAFFISNLVAFWLLLNAFGQTPTLATVFFVWASVFNLFVISLFWSLMSELWQSEQAKRLYGLIAAGGSIGGLAGPLVTQTFVGLIGPNTLLLVSAAFLAAALATSIRLRAVLSDASAAEPGHDKPMAEGGVLAGALQVWNSPYLWRIALCILLANFVSTIFYFEQARIVKLAIADRAERVQLFARMDFTVSALTILIQVLATGRIMERFGAGIAAALLPASAVVGLLALALAPTLAVIVAIIVTERAIAFSLSSPAMRVFYTLVQPEEKYKAQNFIDTVVYRGGDAASGWAANALGVGVVAMAAFTLPFAGAWLVLTLLLGRQAAAKSADNGPDPKP